MYSHPSVLSRLKGFLYQFGFVHFRHVHCSGFRSTGAIVGPGQRRWHREPTTSLCTISDEPFAVLLLDQVKENQTENHKFERNWLKAKHKGTSWGYLSQMMRTKLHQLQMRQHQWKSLDAMRVAIKEIRNCLLITHNGLVASDSLHARAMDRSWHASFILITLPCNINDIPA
jgi:hypothetical protein